jgi:hypothetical protein
MAEMIIKNSDVVELILAVPEGHQHLRATLRLADGSSIVLQEATVANLTRAYVTVMTSPTLTALRLEGRQVEAGLKEGYSPWQLIETP